MRDFVILSREKAKEAMGRAQATLTRMGRTLNERKTSIRNARKERFDFLGYTFGPHFSRRTGREYIGCSPSKKSVNRIKEKVGEHLKASNVGPGEEVRDRLNQKLRGWKAYFGLGSPTKANEVLDEHVEEVGHRSLASVTESVQEVALSAPPLALRRIPQQE